MESGHHACECSPEFAAGPELRSQGQRVRSLIHRKKNRHWPGDTLADDTRQEISKILSFPLTFVRVWFLFPWFCPVTIYLSWRPLLFPKSPPLVKLLFPLLSPPISAVRCFSRVLLTESTDGEQTLVFPIREALKISRRRSRVCRPSHIPIQHVANMF